MSGIEPIHCPPTPLPSGVLPLRACPTSGLNQHRLEARPVVQSLLGEAPGSVPYSTYLEIDAARARLVDAALHEGLARLGGARADYGELAAEHGPRAEEPTQDRSPLPIERAVPRVEYTLARRKWPIGGLIDLVI